MPWAGCSFALGRRSSEFLTDPGWVACTIMYGVLLAILDLRGEAGDECQWR